MTARRAIVLGHLAVTLPIVVLFALAYLLDRRVATPASFAAIPVAFLVAWLYWSLAVPRWRLWALANVVDAPCESLLARAASSGLLWREGSWLERTELRQRDYSRSRALAQLLGELRRLRLDVLDAEQDDWGANAFEEIRRHIDPLVTDLARGDLPAGGLQRLSALGAQLQLATDAGLTAISPPLADSARRVLQELVRVREFVRPGDAPHVAI